MARDGIGSNGMGRPWRGAGVVCGVASPSCRVVLMMSARSSWSRERHLSACSLPCCWVQVKSATPMQRPGSRRLQGIQQSARTFPAIRSGKQQEWKRKAHRCAASRNGPEAQYHATKKSLEDWMGLMGQNGSWVRLRAEYRAAWVGSCLLATMPHITVEIDTEAFGMILYPISVSSQLLCFDVQIGSD